MKKIFLIWIFVMFLLLIPFSFAVVAPNVTIALFPQNLTHDNSSELEASVENNPEYIISQGGKNENLTIGIPSVRFNSSSGALTSVNFSAGGVTAPPLLANMKNGCIQFWTNDTSAVDLAGGISQTSGVGGGSSDGMYFLSPRTVPSLRYRFTLTSAGCGASCDFNIINNGDLFNSTWKLMTATWDYSGSNFIFKFYVNLDNKLDSTVGVATGLTIGAGRNLLIGRHSPESTAVYTGALAGVLFYVNHTCDSNDINWSWNNGVPRNFSEISPPGPLDLTPPSITYFNLTNGNGCEVWNTSNNIACNTSSGTPTVQFNTDEAAWCAISGNSSATLGKNYTDMGSSKNCTGAAAGEGSTSHLCTLRNEDELIFETSYIYISCRDTANNQNRTSTSGPLNVSVTAEANARDAIETGIRNSLSSAYTVYTDQRIYARNSANSQATGKFDKVVKKFSKIWAFNRISEFESHVNMFNITPVLYTLEFANKTSVYIENQTALLINATK